MYISSPVEEEMSTNMRPCGTKIESMIHIVGECEM